MEKAVLVAIPKKITRSIVLKKAAEHRTKRKCGVLILVVVMRVLRMEAWFDK